MFITFLNTCTGRVIAIFNTYFNCFRTEREPLASQDVVATPQDVIPERKDGTPKLEDFGVSRDLLLKHRARLESLTRPKAARFSSRDSFSTRIYFCFYVFLISVIVLLKRATRMYRHFLTKRALWSHLVSCRPKTRPILVRIF